MLKLSICIPTFNFGHTIGETLDSILSNDLNGVEIIVFDGGSNDNTKIEVALRQENFSRLFYHYQGYKGGIDRDIEKAVSLSKGKYCWLFSADDIMIQGSISKILKELEANYEVYLCEQILCDKNMNVIKEHPIFMTFRNPKTFDFREPQERALYFDNARTTEAFFSYLAGPIFKKTLWDSVNNLPASFYSSCWCHSGRLLTALNQAQNAKVHYLGQSLIMKRAGIDSFLSNGLVNRLAITIIELSNIAYSIYGKNSKEAFHMRRTIRNEDYFSFRNLISLKLQFFIRGESDNLLAFNKLVRVHYSNAGPINKLKFYFFTYTPIYIFLLIKTFKDNVKEHKN